MQNKLLQNCFLNKKNNKNENDILIEIRDLLKIRDKL